MKNYIFGFLTCAVLTGSLAWAGSYAITLNTTPATDTIVPIFVAQYNLKHGTSFTGLQWASKVCNDAVDQKAKMFLEAMGQ